MATEWMAGIAYAELDELVAQDMLDPGAAAFLRAAVGARQSIVFAGAPGRQDDPALVLRRRARPVAPGGGGRGSL